MSALWYTMVKSHSPFPLETQKRKRGSPCRGKEMTFWSLSPQAEGHSQMPFQKTPSVRSEKLTLTKLIQ